LESYKAGDEVYLSYGDDKDNWKLLLTYGFATSSNPNWISFWTWEELLLAAKAVRPTIFTDRVCTSLLNHPQLQQYTRISENRATFSFDIRQNVPRESLQNGLTMISNLVVQLGHPAQDDTALHADLLEQLKKQRVHELRTSNTEVTKQIQSLLSTTEEEWIPFLKSVNIAVKKELDDLQLLLSP
jgi:hypothetical protein